MNFSETMPLPTPSEFCSLSPVTTAQRSFIAKSRDTIKRILGGEDPRLLLIVGPCSIHEKSAALEYAFRFNELSAAVSDTFYLVMRCYTEKSRTALGWKGLLNDPYLDNSHQIVDGIKLTRDLLLELATLEIPAAAELVDPLSAPFYADLLAWGCIGARTAESQTHRLLASADGLPIGIKNNTSGNLEAAINGVFFSTQPHTFIGLQDDGRAGIVKTAGNPYVHVVLRGGEKSPNYDPKSIQKALLGLQKCGLPKRVVIDCSHDNSKRNPHNQSLVLESAVKQMIEGNTAIRGLILESHLFEGHQSLLQPLKYAVSITDPCLDWPNTSNLIKEARRLLRHFFQEALLS